MCLASNNDSAMPFEGAAQGGAQDYQSSLLRLSVENRLDEISEDLYYFDQKTDTTKMARMVQEALSCTFSYENGDVEENRAIHSKAWSFFLGLVNAPNVDITKPSMKHMVLEDLLPGLYTLGKKNEFGKQYLFAILMSLLVESDHAFRLQVIQKTLSAADERFFVGQDKFRTLHEALSLLNEFRKHLTNEPNLLAQVDAFAQTISGPYRRLLVTVHELQRRIDITTKSHQDLNKCFQKAAELMRRGAVMSEESRRQYQEQVLFIERSQVWIEGWKQELQHILEV